MENPSSIMMRALERIEQRLDAVDAKLETVTRTRLKSMEWIATLSEHIRSLDEFREEVRASFEPLIGKLDNLDEVTRILRHATNDVSRRIDTIEGKNLKVG